jgi:hypothetical protein
MFEFYYKSWPSQESFPFFEVAFVIVCQGELSVAFEAADPKVLVVAYLVEASINVGLMRVE